MHELKVWRYRFPWRDDNRVALLIDGEQFYPAMLQAIENAQQIIYLEMYLLSSGQVLSRFINALIAAAERGVHVAILLDDFGCRGVSKSDRDRLKHTNIQIVYYNPLHYGKYRRNLFRNHRKLLITDGRVAFVGGAGITDDFEKSKHNRRPWRDTMLQIEGPCVDDWVNLFAQTWRFTTNKALSLPEMFIQQFENGVLGRVACSRGRGFQEIKRTLVKRIRSSERCVWIASAYFVPSIKIRRALAKASRRGVDVRLLLPGEFTDHPAVRHAGRRFYYHLLRAGVRVYEFKPRFTHAKVLMCDSWVSVGSSNIDRWNFRWNLEANQEVDDHQFAREVEAMFENDFAQSSLYSLDDWQQRSRYWRLLEWFWGRIDVLLDRFTGHGRLHSQKREK